MTDEHTDEYLEKAVESEYDYCITRHGHFKNHHEAYGVMKEEMEELSDAAELFDSLYDGVAFNTFTDLWEMVKADNMSGANEKIKVIHDAAEELVKEGVQVQAMCRKWNDLLAREGEANANLGQQ